MKKGRAWDTGMREKRKQQKSYLYAVWKRFLEHRAGVISLVIVALIVIAALLAPVLAKWEPNSIGGGLGMPPGNGHLLGTDEIGRDMFSRLLYGTRISLLVGILSTLISTIIGVALGLISGFFGGVVDMVIMRLTDIIMSFPYILLVLVSGQIFGPGMWNIILILGFVDWPGMARLVRGSVLSLKEADFVNSSKISDMPIWYILFSEIFLNVIGSVLIYATTIMSASILDEAALSFLGMGVQLPDPSLGNLLNGAESLSILTYKPWIWVPSGIVIILLVLGVNFIGDALRDALDPTTESGD